MPTLDPARAGFTNTGSFSALASRGQACVPVGPQSRGATDDVRARPAARPPRAATFITALSIAAAEASTPEPTYGHAGELEQALDRAVLAVRAVQQREDDVDRAEHARRLAGLVHDQAARGRVAGEHDRGAGAVDLGQRAAGDGQPRPGRRPRAPSGRRG